MSAIASEAPHRGRFLSGGFFLRPSPSLRSSLKVSPKKHNKEFFFWKVGLFRIDMKMHARMYFDLRDFSLQTLVVAFFFDMLHMFCWLYEKFQIWYFRKKFCSFRSQIQFTKFGPKHKENCILTVSAVFLFPDGFFGRSRNQSLFGSYFLKIDDAAIAFESQMLLLQIERRCRLFARKPSWAAKVLMHTNKIEL